MLNQKTYSGFQSPLNKLKSVCVLSCLTALVAMLAFSSAFATSAKINTELPEKFVAQSDTSTVYEIVEQMPEIEGGISEVYKHIKYPRAAVSGQIEGRVFVKFVVDANGKVKDAQVLKDIGAGCGKAAIEGIKKVTFKPGKHNGEPVAVYYTLPVNFKIES